MSTLNFIDLFAGAGGLSEGFINAGFEPIAHVEMDSAACYTLRTRQAYYFLKEREHLKSEYSKYLRKEISRKSLYSFVPDEYKNNVLNYAIGEKNNSSIFDEIDLQINKRDIGKNVDLIIGGPPCQAYSLVGRARSSNGMATDQRNYLYLEYAKYLSRYNPKMFVFENVPGLLSANGGIYFSNMKKRFRTLGYEVEPFKVEANNFGVLQNRKRIIIIGWKKELTPNLPNLEKNNNKWESHKVSDLFSDLPFLYAGEGLDKYLPYKGTPTNYLTEVGLRTQENILTQHVARPHTIQDKEIYRIAVEKWDKKRERLNYNDLPERLKTHQNRHSFFDRFKVVAGNESHSQTVVAHIAKDGHYYIHPDIEQNRSITVREAARIQSFPDNYYFEGVKEGTNRTAAFKQIGNAVPPLMAYEIAEIIKTVI